jgi:hypothetical protein
MTADAAVDHRAISGGGFGGTAKPPLYLRDYGGQIRRPDIS